MIALSCSLTSNVIGHTSAIVTAPPAPQVQSVTVGAFSNGVLPLVVSDLYSSNGDAVAWVIYPAGENAPSVPQVKSGLQRSGAPATAGGNGVRPGPLSATLPDGIARDDYRLAVVVTGSGGDSNVGVSDPFLVDTTAAILTGVSFADDGSEGINWTFEADENSAAVTGYRVSYFAAGATPSNSEIETGSGAISSTTGSATGSIAEIGAFASVGVGTYVPTIFYEDEFGNRSYATYANVTVAATSSLTLSQVTTGSQSTTKTPTISGLDLSGGTEFWLIWSRDGSNGVPSMTYTLDGQAGSVEVSDQPGNKETVWIVKFTGVSGSSGDLVISDSGTNTSARDAYTLFVASAAAEVKAAATRNSTVKEEIVSLDVNVASGEVALIGVTDEFNSAVPPFASVTGFTAIENASLNNRGVLTGKHDVTVNETPRTFSADGTASRRKAIAVASIGAI